MYYHYKILFSNGKSLAYHTKKHSRAAADKHLRSLGLTPGVDAVFQYASEKS